MGSNRSVLPLLKETSKLKTVLNFNCRVNEADLALRRKAAGHIKANGLAVSKDATGSEAVPLVEPSMKVNLIDNLIQLTVHFFFH